MKNLDVYNVKELQSDELVTIDGGVEPITVTAAGIAVLGVAAVGVVIVGAVAAYGIYKLIDWATE